MLYKYVLEFIFGRCFHPDVSRPYDGEQMCLRCGARREFDQWNYKVVGKWHFTVKRT